jgi:uncharacterized protein (DUF433 family)
MKKVKSRIKKIFSSLKPCIHGLRFLISSILRLIESGETKEIIFKTYPHLEAKDIDETLRYATYLAERGRNSIKVGSI